MEYGVGEHVEGGRKKNGDDSRGEGKEQVVRDVQ